VSGKFLEDETSSRWWAMHRHAPDTAILVARTSFVTNYQKLRKLDMKNGRDFVPKSHHTSARGSTLEAHIDASTP